MEEHKLINKRIRSERMTFKELHIISKLARKHGLNEKYINDLKIVEEKTRQEINQIEKRIATAEKRKDFNKANYIFELNRTAFYRKLKSVAQTDHSIEEKEVFQFWEKMWNKEKISNNYEHLLKDNSETQSVIIDKIEISEEYIYSLIKRLNNWKAPGPDKVYNFFIKKLSSIHLPIYKAIEKAIREPESVPKSFFIGNTY